MAHCKPKRISWISRSSKWFRYLSKISDTLINLPRMFKKNQRKHNGQSKWSHLVVDNKLRTNIFYGTSSTNEKRDILANDTETRRNESSLGWIGTFLVQPSCWIVFAGSILSPPLSTSPLAARRFLCCVLLDCQQMLVGEWKLCLSFPIHQFHLQSQGCKLVRKKKEEVFIPLNTLRLSFDVVNLDSVNLYSITFIAVCAGEPWRTFTTKSFIGVSSLTSAIVVTGTAAAEILLETK